VIGVTVQGISHQKTGLPCQDALEYRLLAGDLLLAAVADGAGTAVHSQIGARRAARTALDTLSVELQEGILPEDEASWGCVVYIAFEEAQQALHRLSEEAGEPLRDFATTLTCVIAGNGWLVAGQLGDGAVVIQDGKEDFLAITRLQKGEYANETYFLTQEEALDQVEVQVLQEKVHALALMSDGLTRLALKRPTNEPHQPFFQPLFGFTSQVEDPKRAQEQLSAFLSSERVNTRTDDDKALLLAVYHPQTDQAAEETTLEEAPREENLVVEENSSRDENGG
jgi:serine/threonine protein phosphatase PrpC